MGPLCPLGPLSHKSHFPLPKFRYPSPFTHGAGRRAISVMQKRVIPPHGGYKQLLSYQKTVLIYELTVLYCNRFLQRGDRTIDQMIQAARSGKQNIVEGSMASATSSEMELKLTNVARASLEELLEDYRDALRIAGECPWEKDSAQSRYMRTLGKSGEDGREKIVQLARQRPVPVFANMMLCLIHQANYLLDQQIRKLEKDFTLNGGIRERMARARRGR